MIMIPYWKKFFPDEKEVDRLYATPDKRLKSKIKNVTFADDDERNGWYKKEGIVPVEDDVHKELLEKDLILTYEEAVPWLRKQGVNV